MSEYRRLYNQILELKFSLLDKNKDAALSDCLKMIDYHLQDLDALASRRDYNAMSYIKFIDGSLIYKKIA